MTTMMHDIVTNAGIKIPAGATGFYTHDHKIIFVIGSTGKIIIKRMSYAQQEKLRERGFLGSFGWSIA